MRARPAIGSSLHRLGVAILAAVLALAIGASPGMVRPALAAGPLRVSADATYEVDPGDGRVRVSIDFALTNRKPSTATTIFYYSNYLFAIQPEAVRIEASDASGALAVTTDERRNFTRVDVRLRSFLYYNETARFTLRYDLPGGAARSSSWVRVGRAFATFGVWAWGDAGRGTVEVRMPEGFETTVDGDRLLIDRGGAAQILTAEPKEPDAFYAIVSGDNDSAYTSARVSLAGDVEVVVRAWPEDRRWQQSVTSTIELGMLELVELIGLDWPVAHDLEIRERFTPALEGYAGVYLLDEERIEVSEDLDPLTIMHEASHAWFNDDLFAERWIYEGLAEEYSWRVQEAVGGPSGFGPLLPLDDDPGRFPLDHWAFPRVIRDQQTEDRELYGYAASFWVIHTVVEAAGEDQMRSAFQAADADRTAYPGAPAPETVPPIDDWRRFLDLVQPIDRPDAPAVEAAVSDLVLSPADASMIDERHDARERYRELTTAGDGWLPPWSVRAPMGTWTFDDAGAAMDEAFALLERREAVEAAAGVLGVVPGDELREAYELATDDLAEAEGIAKAQLDVLAALDDAKTRLAAPMDGVAQLGLLGATAPAAAYDEAVAAYQRGDLGAATASAAAVTSTLIGAAALGQERLLLAAIVAAGIVVLLVMLFLVRRRRRRHALATSPAVAAELEVPDPALDVPATAPAVPASALDVPAPPHAAGDAPAWPATDLAPRTVLPEPEPAWWLPTRNAVDPPASDPPVSDPPAPDPGTLAADPPDVEGESTAREPSDRAHG